MANGFAPHVCQWTGITVEPRRPTGLVHIVELTAGDGCNVEHADGRVVMIPAGAKVTLEVSEATFDAVRRILVNSFSDPTGGDGHNPGPAGTPPG